MRFLFAAVMFVAWAAPALAEDWSVFTDPSGTFSPQVPQPPAYSGETDVAVPSQRYMIDHGISFMLMTVGDHRGTNIDADATIAVIVRNLKQDRILISDDAVSLDGHAGHDLRVSTAGGSLITYRVFCFGGQVFLLTTMAPRYQTYYVDEVDRFSASLHFLH